MTRTLALAALTPLVAVAGGCNHASASGDGGGQVVVFAAASLTDAFTDLAHAFEAEHPGVTVKLNFAGSHSLRTQIANGAQPQVFASANAKHMDALRAEHLVGEPVVFAHNRLVIAVPAGNPAGVHGLADLPRAERLVLAGVDVPAGAYAEKVLASAGAAYGADFAERVEKRVVSRENNVRQTLQKVVLGEADAAIVYATDAASAGDRVEIVDIPAERNVIADYPIATVNGSSNPELAAAFVAFVRSEAGRAGLAARGFEPAR